MPPYSPASKIGSTQYPSLTNFSYNRLFREERSMWSNGLCNSITYLKSEKKPPEGGSLWFWFLGLSRARRFRLARLRRRVHETTQGFIEGQWLAALVTYASIAAFNFSS